MALALTPNFGIGRVFGAELDADVGVLIATSIDALNRRDTIQTDFNLFFFSVRVFTGPEGISDIRGGSFSGGGNIGFGIVQDDFSAKFTLRDGLVIGQ